MKSVVIPLSKYDRQSASGKGETVVGFRAHRYCVGAAAQTHKLVFLLVHTANRCVLVRVRRSIVS